MDTTDLTLMDAAIATHISSGAVGIIQFRDAMGNSVQYPNAKELIDARNAIATVAAKSARTSSFDKIKFATKS